MHFDKIIKEKKHTMNKITTKTSYEQETQHKK